MKPLVVTDLVADYLNLERQVICKIQENLIIKNNNIINKERTTSKASLELSLYLVAWELIFTLNYIEYMQH